MSGHARIAPGDTILGYEVVELAGRGGMGDVFRAQDTRLDRPVALKLLAERLSDDQSFRERLLRESRLAASLDHPNVIPIYEAGESDGRLFIAMRYVHGTDLKRLLRDEGALEPAHAIGIASQVADALDAAHARGLVHRDVKPSNVLLDRQEGREHAYLADFGLTQSASDVGPTDGQLMGTTDYVAPEQIRGDQVDGRADVYALGCLLFETLTGSVPFAGATDVAVVYAHLEQPPPRASERATGLSPALDDVLVRAMAKDPRERHSTCSGLVDDARDALGLVPTQPSRRRIVALAGVATALAAVLATTATLLLAGGEADAPATGKLVRIDAATGEVTRTYDVSADPGVITTSAGRVWMGDFPSGTLWRLDPTTGDLRKLTAAGEPRDLTSLDGKVYVMSDGAEPLTGTVTRYDAVTGGKESGLNLLGCAIGAGQGVVWSCASPNVDRLSTTLGKLRIVRTTTLPLREPRTVGTTRLTGRDLAVGLGSLWVVGDGVDRRLWRLDRLTGRIVATIELPMIPRTVATGEGAVWVSAPLDDAILRIDPATNTVTATIGTGRGTSGVAAGGGAVWATNAIDGTVSRIDPETAKVVEQIDVGGRPREIAVGAGGVWVSSDAS